MFAIPLPLSGAPGIEMRTQGGTYTLMLTFDRPVVLGTATIASGVGTVNSLPSFSGNTATVQLSGVANRQTITVELDNVVGITGVTSKVLVAMSVLVGDVNQDGAVTGIDSDLVRSSSGASVTADTFKKDVTANGFINSGDFSATGTGVYQGAALFPDFAFTGHYYHARSGLYLAPYRAYNPSVGRWINRDPIGEDAGINLYGYVRNDPLVGKDPLGLFDTGGFLARLGAGAAIGGAVGNLPGAIIGAMAAVLIFTPTTAEAPSPNDHDKANCQTPDSNHRRTCIYSCHTREGSIQTQTEAFPGQFGNQCPKLQTVDPDTGLVVDCDVISGPQ
jgi:RHS repeat-associated protein